MGRDDVCDDFRRPNEGFILLAPVLATTTGFLLIDFWLLSPEDDLPVLSRADLITDVEGLGMDTATSSLNRVVIDLRVVAGRPDRARTESVGVASSSKTASSLSTVGLDISSRSDEGDAATILEALLPGPESEVELELDFLSIGGGRFCKFDLRFSLEHSLDSGPVDSGLVGVGVAERSSSSSVGDKSL